MEILVFIQEPGADHIGRESGKSTPLYAFLGLSIAVCFELHIARYRFPHDSI